MNQTIWVQLCPSDYVLACSICVVSACARARACVGGKKQIHKRGTTKQIFFFLTGILDFQTEASMKIWTARSQSAWKGSALQHVPHKTTLAKLWSHLQKAQHMAAEWYGPVTHTCVSVAIQVCAKNFKSGVYWWFPKLFGRFLNFFGLWLLFHSFFCLHLHKT